MEIMARKITVFITPCIFDEFKTGGEFYYKYLRNVLENQKDVEIVLPDKNDKEIMNRSRGIFNINWWFFRRFMTLPKGSVIIQDQMFRFAHFLANWLMNFFRKDIRIITIVHETSYQKYKGLKIIKNKIITHLFYRSSNLIIVNSEFIGKEVCSSGGYWEKIIVRNIPGQRLNIKPIPKKENTAQAKILCIANIRPRKGQKYLIEAIKLLNGHKIRATFAGLCKDESYEKELCSLIKEYGLKDRVKIVGWLGSKRLAEAYQESDILVLPSLYEPLGMVIHEAMQFGLPIVASDTGGIPEQVTNLREALLVPPGDPEALAKAIERLLNDLDLRNRLVRNAYERSKNRPTWREYFEEVISLILSNP